MSGRDLIENHYTAELIEKDGGDLFSQLVEAPLDRSVESTIIGVLVGDLVGLSNNGCSPLVPFAALSENGPLIARTIIELSDIDIGRQVVLQFEEGNITKPIIMGLLQQTTQSKDKARSTIEISVDGERLTVSAKEQLVLRCGKASITLTREGKVLLQGTYLSSRSTGVNRIKGGSVDIN